MEGRDYKGHEAFLGVMDMFIVLIVVLVSRTHKYVQTYQIVHFKCVQIICQLHLNKAVKKVIHADDKKKYRKILNLP